MDILISKYLLKFFKMFLSPCMLSHGLLSKLLKLMLNTMY